MVLIALALTVVALSALFYHWRCERPPNFPPGPNGIPVFGNAFQMGSKAYKVALEMKKEYGDIIGVQFGTRWCVILNNPEDIREAFSKSEFTGRVGFNLFLDEDAANVNYGLIMSYGKTWMDNRRFTLRTLRDFGLGKRTMETIIMEEVHELVEKLATQKEKPMSTIKIFNLAVFNVTWSIVAGQRYSLDDEQLSEITDLLIEFMSTLFKGARFLFLLFPSLVRLKNTFPFLFPSVNEKFRQKLLNFLRKTIQDHRHSLSEGNPRDLIDAYLEDDAKIKVGNSKTGCEESDDYALAVVLMDLFIAGSETTSTTLCWSFFLLALHPRAQERFFEEVDSIASGRDIFLEDKARLPYAEATIMEITRISSIAPFGVPHATTEDVKLKNYDLPKNTQVFANLYATHFDPELWERPQEFHPDRFLCPDQKKVLRGKAWLPFGVGKRSCLGESLARDEIFLFLTNLVKSFRIEMAPDEPLHSLEGVRGGVNTPEPHRVVLFKRRM